MKIRINKVEGRTKARGSKQGHVFQLKPDNVPDFYTAIREDGKEYAIWDVNGNWSEVGIGKPCGRMSYTKDFQIIQ